MLLQGYLTQPDRVLASVRFHYQGGRYHGRGVLTWNADEGFHTEAPVERFGPRIRSIGFGLGGVVREQDLRSIHMKEHNSQGWILAPQVILRDRLDLVIQNRISIPVARIIISEPQLNIIQPENTWRGSALFKLTDSVIMPDRISQELRINEQALGESWSSSGILYESDQGQRVLGRVVDRQYLELNYHLPLENWSKTEAFRWPDAARDSLSICLGQSVALIQKNVTRNLRSYTDIHCQREIQDVRPFTPFNNDQILDRDRFVGIANFLARNEQGSDVCRRIFLQMAEAEKQRTWQGRALLLATIMEATLRTLEGHPFRAHDRSFIAEQAFTRFQNRYFSEAWADTCERAYQTFRRLRHRNAHPDWLYEETGALSDDQRSETYNDMVFLSKFYGYMILAISGFTDITPPS
jgi:hypothetical protein